ncbi:MAG: Fe(3+) ABC transporter substrate-binding protein [Spirochaetota bacterium]
MIRTICGVVLSIVFVSVAALGFASGSAEDVDDSGDTSGDEAGSVNVYSHRHYEVDRELYDEFTSQTGIEVNVVEAGADELIQRLEREGENTPADILVTVDAGRLNRARDRGLLESVSSQRLETQVPEALRDEENFWFGLTQRARVVVYDPERVERSELSTYEDLSSPKWQDRIAVRSSGNIYNVSLLASLVAHHGRDEATEWAEGIVDNFARSPQGNDRDQIRAVAAGVADLAIVNTYYLGIMHNSDDPRQREVAEEVELFFPNQEGRGAHVNVSGAGVTKHASNPEAATQLLEFLTGESAQRSYAAANYEYPVNPDVDAQGVVADWGEFKADDINLGLLGDHADEAIAIFDEVGWR